MNPVELDPVALDAEADRLLASAPAELTGATPAIAPTNVVELPPANSWKPLVAGITPMVRIALFSRWGIRPEEETEFVESGAQCLDLCFPGGLDGKYGCFVRLISCCTSIAGMRYLQHGELPPIGLPSNEEPDAKAKASGAGDASDRKAA